MKNIIIVGNGGFAAEIIQYLNDLIGFDNILIGFNGIE